MLCWQRWAEGKGGRAWAVCRSCHGLLPGNISGAEEKVRGIWGTPEQQLPADAPAAPSPPWEELGRAGVVWRVCLGGAGGVCVCVSADR